MEGGIITDKASTEAALGSQALGVGDTLSAQEHYSEAAQVLESESHATGDSSRRTLLLFLAASQYFHGGDYKQAQKLARRIEERLLPASAKELFQPFVRDVEIRANPGYTQAIRDKLVDLRSNAKFSEALELLKSHPYVLNRAQLSYARASLCEELKRYHAAAVFHARAIEFDPDCPKLPYLSTARLLWLPVVGKLDEAWSYVELQRKEIAHPVTDIAASVLRYRKASISHGDEQKIILKEQVQYFEKAWSGFQKMVKPLQDDPELRGLMSLCFELAAFALWKLDENEQSIRVCDEGIAFNPRHAGLFNIRGIVLNRTPQGPTDFEKAILLGEQTYSPHYYLAQHALEEERFDDARKHINEAIRRGPGPQIRAQLIGWLAICLTRDKNMTVFDISAVFEEAIALAPDLAEIKENYAAFRRSVEKATPPPAPKDLQLEPIKPVEFWDTSYFERKLKDPQQTSVLL